MTNSLRPLSRAEVRDVDRRAIDEFGMPGIVLMENAGRGAAELLVRLGIGGQVIVCAGKGNNGGDGFVIARHLENRGVEVRVLLFADSQTLQGDAATNFHILRMAGTPIFEYHAATKPDTWGAELRSCGCIVDALLGTGMQGTVREPMATVIHHINDAGVPVLAVDLPSGLDCDTGQPLGTCVRAAHTATFVARKLGFDVPAAAPFIGEVHVVDIGVPQALFSRFAAGAN
ncbi:MAG TPA: NAD(P)H-hydrate epimerase [Planctomycetaceae bacterium]|jgi:NAD(P)H-hydrate epimerase|nr:NAD(P)H-hydrate epimerase [Planctomycetaceae bacterium]